MTCKCRNNEILFVFHRWYTIVKNYYMTVRSKVNRSTVVQDSSRFLQNMDSVTVLILDTLS